MSPTVDNCNWKARGKICESRRLGHAHVVHSFSPLVTRKLVNLRNDNGPNDVDNRVANRLACCFEALYLATRSKHGRRVFQHRSMRQVDGVVAAKQVHSRVWCELSSARHCNTFLEAEDRCKKTERGKTCACPIF